jgi:hypothetical protein
VVTNLWKASVGPARVKERPHAAVELARLTSV